MAVLPGLAFLAVRARSTGWRFLWAHRGPPVGGMTLAEAAVWLGLLPIAVYALTFAPYAFLKTGAVEPTGLIALHQRMLTTALKRARHVALLPYAPQHLRP